jgi:hypothetical protein
VDFDSAQITQRAILGVIEDLGYQPELVDRGEPAPALATTIEVSELPAEFQELFAEARRLEQPVLLDFIAPG